MNSLLTALLTNDVMDSLLIDNVWFSLLGTRMEIVNELGEDVCFRYTTGNFATNQYIATRGVFINSSFCISKQKKTLLGRLERLSEYCVIPQFKFICTDVQEVDLSRSHVILGKKVSLYSLEMMTDLEFEEILITLTFTPNLL